MRRVRFRGCPSLEVPGHSRTKVFSRNFKNVTTFVSTKELRNSFISQDATPLIAGTLKLSHEWLLWASQWEQEENFIDLSRWAKGHTEHVSPERRETGFEKDQNMIDGWSRQEVSEKPDALTSFLSKLISYNYPLCDDRIQRLIGRIISTITQFPSSSIFCISNILDLSASLFQLKYYEQSRQLLRNAAQGLSFASLHEVKVFCDETVKLFGIPKTQFKANNGPSVENLFGGATFLKEPTWRQGANGMAMIMAGIAQRLLAELRSTSQPDLRISSCLLRCLAEFWFSASPLSTTDPLGLLVSEIQSAVFSEMLTRLKLLVDSGGFSVDLNNDANIDNSDKLVQPLGRCSEEISIESEISIVLNMSKAFCRRAVFTRGIEAPTLCRESKRSTASDILTTITQETERDIRTCKERISEESQQLSRLIARWAMSPRRASGKNLDMTQIPYLAHFQCNQCLELVEDVVNLVQDDFFDASLIEFIASSICHLKANMSDLSALQATSVIKVLDSLKSCRVATEAYDECMGLSLNEHSKKNLSSRNSLRGHKANEARTPLNMKNGVIIHSGVSVNYNEQKTKVDSSMSMRQLMLDFLPATAISVDLLDVNDCVFLLTAMNFWLLPTSYIDANLEMRIIHQIDQVKGKQLVELIEALTQNHRINSRLFSQLLLRCLNDISREMISPDIFGRILHSIGQGSEFTKIPLLKYRCEEYIIRHARRFDLDTISRVIEGLDLSGTRPSKGVLDALASSLLDMIHTQPSLEAEPLARCLTSSLRWAKSPFLPIQLEVCIANAITPQIEYLPVSVIITFVLCRHHPALSPHTTAAAFRVLSQHVGDLDNNQLCAVFCSYYRQPGGILRGNGIALGRELTRRVNLSSEKTCKVEIKLCVESLQALLLAEDLTSFPEKYLAELFESLIRTIASHFPKLFPSDVVNLFVSLSAVPKAITETLPKLDSLLSSIDNNLINSLENGKYGRTQTTVNDHYDTQLRTVTKQASFHRFLLRCATGLALSTDASSKLKDSFFSSIYKELPKVDNSILLLMLGAIGRIHVEGRVNKLPPRLVKSVSSRINALADTKMSMLVELAVELNNLGIFNRLASSVQHDIHRSVSEEIRQLLRPIVKCSSPLRDRMMKAEMRRGRMTMKQYLKAKGLSEGAKNKTVIVPIPSNKPVPNVPEVNNPSGKRPQASYVDSLRSAMSTSN